MEKEFRVIIEYLEDKLLQHGVQFQAEMRRLEELTPANYNKILTENEFKEFERILGVMSLTSRETGSLFRQLSDTCVKALKTMGLSTAKKKNIQRIQEHLKEARQAELSYAKRLPFSFGSGWQPGNLSTARVLVNAAG